MNVAEQEFTGYKDFVIIEENKEMEKRLNKNNKSYNKKAEAQVKTGMLHL